MEMSLELSGTEANEKSILDLQDWIKKEQIADIHLERKSRTPKEGEMGFDPMTMLSVILGSAAVVELIKSIHVWLSVRRPMLKVKLKKGTSEIEIDAQNLPDQQELIDKVLARIKEDVE